MSILMEKIRNMLLDEVKENMKNLPFGFGEEEGCAGFPKWFVYIDTDNKLYGKHSLSERFDDNLTPLENISMLPLDKLVLLAENGLSGDDLFNSILEDYTIRNGLGGKALLDAEKWKESNKVKFKP